jgi:hypothetical protein
MKSKNLQSVYSGVKKDDLNRNKNDFYPTPPLATYILHKYSNIPENVVEPCAGRGNISIELIRNGYNVKSFDLYEYSNQLCNIHTGQDVLQLEKQPGYNALVTNPPYHKDLPRKIAEKAVKEYDFVAMFLRLTFLEGKKRKKLFTLNPPSSIIFLSDRIKFEKDVIEPIEKNQQIGGMIAYSWFVWDKKSSHKYTKMDWVLLDDHYDEWKILYNKYNSEKQ